MARVLIIDDDEIYGEMLSEVVRQMGHNTNRGMTLGEGLRLVEREKFDVVFLDVRMPDGNGLEYLPKFRDSHSQPEVIIITGLGDPDGAELAIKSGAWAYVQKGSALEEITLPLTRALQYRTEKSGNKGPVSLKRQGIVGNGPRIKECLDFMALGANSDANFLLFGETGTGKELFARAIHNNSPRHDGPFIVVDCAALPDTLVESVLFGHAKGAYTGADQAEKGLVLQADGGTLFLDEVGELPLLVQKAFLRVLQERVFRPVGGQKEVKSNFRLVAATNRNLDKMVQKTHFRSDLLYRLRSLFLELPPLRECIEDIPDIAMHYMAKFCTRDSKGTKGFSPEFMQALQSYNWPGNVRELVQTIDMALASAQDEPTLHVKHLPPHIRIFVARTAILEETSTNIPVDLVQPQRNMPRLSDFRETMDRQYLKELMEVTQGQVKEACDISGLSRSRLYDLLKKYEIPRTA